MWQRMCYVLCLSALVISLIGCGPSTASIQSTVQQGMQATAISMLSQVDWKQITSSLRGVVGPEFLLEAEAYIKQSAGMTVRVHGGTLSWEMQGSGTGGRDNSTIAEAIIPVITRWEKADDRSKEARQRLTQDVADAILKAWEAKVAASQPQSN